MRPLILLSAVLALAACETTSFGTGITIGSGGTSVTNTISGSSGNATGSVSFDL